MATMSKFNCFVEDLAEKKHDLGADALKILLTNTAPVAGDTVVDTTTATCTIKATSNALEISAANGYAKGGNTVTITASSQTSGTYSLVGNDVVFTASGGTVGAFRYAAFYNNTGGTTTTRPVIGWWDYGSAVTLQDGETFTVDFGASILTLV